MIVSVDFNPSAILSLFVVWMHKPTGVSGVGLFENRVLQVVWRQFTVLSLQNVGGISHVQTRGLRRSVGLQLEQVLMVPLRPSKFKDGESSSILSK